MGEKDPSTIANMLEDSGTITENEKQAYFQYPDGVYYTEEDKALHDKVEKLVKEYQDGTPPGGPTLDNPEADVPTTKPMDPLSTGLPTALDTHGETNGQVSVSTEALTKFRDNIKILEDLVIAEYKKVAEVDVRPGTFGAGVYITQTIQKGLRPDTLNFLQSVGDTFTYLRNDIDTLIGDYTSTEEWNELSVQELNTVFNDAFSNINNYSDYGNSSTDGTGGENNGDGDGDEDPPKK